MDYCLNLNSSTKLKQSTRTTKQNRHFYFTNPTHYLYIAPQSNMLYRIVGFFLKPFCGLLEVLK